jgi:2',3'-cyclic-nucleotide 2'-phosphodiesterase (5'-nucleotidase family)
MKETTPLYLAVDGGSFFTPREHVRALVDNTSLTGMVRMGYAAATIGEYDLRMGAGYLLERAGETGLTLVSANVYDAATGKPLVQPYVIVERGGVRFGITGAMAADLDIRLEKGVEGSGVTVGNAAEALAKLIPEIRKKADFVVLLSHMGLDQSKDLVAAVPGIDFLVVGNQSNFAAKLFDVGTTAFLQPGYKGQYMSVCHLRFDAAGVYQGYEGESVAMDDKVPSDASMALLVKEHKATVDRLSKDEAAQQAQAREAQKHAAQQGEACLGVQGSCRRCHQSQYDQWFATAHAKAFDTLETAQQSTNPACIRCHTTCETDLKQDGSQLVPEELRGVQCESCHGLGARHARDGSYGQVSVSTCLSCHDKEQSPDFDYTLYLPKVTH